MDDRQLIFQVAGNSMNPLLHEGDRILVEPMQSYEIGDIVVTPHPIQTDLTIVKQIESISSDGRLRLRGTNPKESTDRFGLVESSRVIGKFVGKLDEKR